MDTEAEAKSAEERIALAAEAATRSSAAALQEKQHRIPVKEDYFLPADEVAAGSWSCPHFPVLSRICSENLLKDVDCYVRFRPSHSVFQYCAMPHQHQGAQSLLFLLGYYVCTVTGDEALSSLEDDGAGCQADAEVAEVSPVQPPSSLRLAMLG